MMEPFWTDPADDPSPAAWRERIRTGFRALQAQEAPLVVETRDGVQMEARVESLDETKGRMVLSIPRAASHGLEADDEVHLSFSLQANRWTGRARIHYHNDLRTRFTLVWPTSLAPGDRRREARVCLDTIENVKATFRPTGLAHCQVSGRLSNLSEGGFRLAVEGAWDLVEGRAVDPGDVELEEQQVLERLEISGLRPEPLEAEGIIQDVDPQPLGPILGVRFRALSGEDHQFLQGFVQTRLQSAPVEPGPPEPLAEAQTDVQTAEPPAPTKDGETSPSPYPIPESLRLKRFRTLALVMPPGPAREALQAFLAAQGFTRVLPAGTLLELAGMARKTPPDAILVDWPDPAVSELDIVHFLGHHPFPAPPRVVLACVHVTTHLAREAHRLGVSHLLVKPYALDGDLVEMFLRQLKGDDA